MRELLRAFRRATTEHAHAWDQALTDLKQAEKNRDKAIAQVEKRLIEKNKAAQTERDARLDTAAKYAEAIDSVYIRAKSILESYGLDPTLLDEALRKAPEPKEF